MDREIVTHETDGNNQADWVEGYRQMAADAEHEMEAEVRAEAMIGDAF